MLPAIWFILSRQGCDQAALAAGLGQSLTSPEECAAINAALGELRCGCATRGAGSAPLAPRPPRRRRPCLHRSMRCRCPCLRSLQQPSLPASRNPPPQRGAARQRAHQVCPRPAARRGVAPRGLPARLEGPRGALLPARLGQARVRNGWGGGRFWWDGGGGGCLWCRGLRARVPVCGSANAGAGCAPRCWPGRSVARRRMGQAADASLRHAAASHAPPPHPARARHAGRGHQHASAHDRHILAGAPHRRRHHAAATQRAAADGRPRGAARIRYAGARGGGARARACLLLLARGDFEMDGAARLRAAPEALPECHAAR